MGRALLAGLLFAPVLWAAPVPPDDGAARMRRTYGTVRDPDEGTEFNYDRGALHVTVPEDKRLFERWRNFFNAPRTAREVSGDFTATIRVSFPIRARVPAVQPGGDEARAGGGWVVWVDKENVVTVTRDEWVFGKKMYSRFRGNSRFANDGRTESQNIDTEQYGYLRIQRKGKELEGSYSTDGKKWVPLCSYRVDWPNTLSVVVAENNFQAPFYVAFDEYTLTADKKRIAE